MPKLFRNDVRKPMPFLPLGVKQKGASRTPLVFMKLFRLFFLCPILLAAAAPRASSAPPAPSSDPAIREAVEATYPAIVRIEVVEEKGSSGRMMKTRATGSGVIISKEGHLVTNHHVAGKAGRILCRLHDGEEVAADLLGADAMTDLAALRLRLHERPPGAKPPAVARFADSDKVKVGDVCFAMGSPAGLSQSVTRGIVSNVAMITPRRGSFRLDGENVGELVRWLGHDAVIFPGNSGGPLVNEKGEIIGINEVGIGSLGGAIPGNLARKVAEELIEKGEVTRSWTGIEIQPMLDPTENGVLVAGVIEDSPAAEAGLLPGDVITKFDGKKTNARIPEDLPIFHRITLSTPVGKKVTLHGLRGDKPRTWNLVTSLREAAHGKERELKTWGITARDFTLLSSLEARREDKSGAQVHSVRRGGPASNAKPAILPGDVIIAVGGKPVENVDALVRLTRAVTEKAKEAVPTLVSYERDRAHLLTVVKLGPEAEENRPVQAWKAWAGVSTQVLTRDLSEALGLNRGAYGVRVVQTYPGTPSEKADLRPGDIILRMDGQLIRANRPEDAEVFGNMIREYKVGAEVTFSCLRDGKPLELALTLDKRPTPANELDDYEDKTFEFTARELSFADRVNHRLEERAKGLLIENAQSAGWASLAGLRQGDVLLKVDGRPVSRVEELEKQMDRVTQNKSERIAFFVKRGIHTLFVELEPDWE